MKFFEGGGGENFRLDFKRIIHGEKGGEGDQGNGWHSNWKLLNNESPRDFIQTLNKNDQS